MVDIADLSAPWILLVFISTVGACASLLSLWKGVQGARDASEAKVVSQEVHVIVNSQRTVMEETIESLTGIRQSLEQETRELKRERRALNEEIGILKIALSESLRGTSYERGEQK